MSAGGQTVLLASQGLRGQTHTGAQGTLTVLQQGGQQILLPPGFHASTLNIKTLQGLKVIPLTPAQAAAPNKGIYVDFVWIGIWLNLKSGLWYTTQ